VQNHIKKETKVANQDENRPHNRYTDIVPFDDNYIQLSSQTFTDKNTSYVNASLIEFREYPDNSFIATQAPRPNTIKHFWHMVIQAEVKVIVMITRLVEGSGSSRKKKADCYWPDKKVEGDSELGLEIDLGGGCKVQHLTTSYQGKYFQRKFSVWLPDGGIRQVTQIQTELWPDLSAPEGPRILVDLLHRAQDLHVEAGKNSQGRGAGPMLVHCSAGVGRTGTFLALYKLWLDYTNENVKSLAIFPTVLSMRHQRCKTVQRAAQYVYIAKCLSHMVSTEKGDYYEC
jgi:protein tyrosine phosphatase